MGSTTVRKEGCFRRSRTLRRIHKGCWDMVAAGEIIGKTACSDTSREA